VETGNEKKNEELRSVATLARDRPERQCKSKSHGGGGAGNGTDTASANSGLQNKKIILTGLNVQVIQASTKNFRSG
jgi:hypothetical protein